MLNNMASPFTRSIFILNHAGADGQCSTFASFLERRVVEHHGALRVLTEDLSDLAGELAHAIGLL